MGTGGLRPRGAERNGHRARRAERRRQVDADAAVLRPVPAHHRTRVDPRRRRPSQQHGSPGARRLPRPAPAHVPNSSGWKRRCDWAAGSTHDGTTMPRGRGSPSWGIPPRPTEPRCQRSQAAMVALVVCLAKTPDVIVLDEPLASLDPLARRQLMETLLGVVTDRGTTVFVSSHIISELEPVCETTWSSCPAGRARIAGSVESLLSEHHVVVHPLRRRTRAGQRRDRLSGRGQRQTTTLVRGDVHGAISMQRPRCRDQFGGESCWPIWPTAAATYVRRQRKGYGYDLARLASVPADHGRDSPPCWLRSVSGWRGRR